MSQPSDFAIANKLLRLATPIAATALGNTLTSVLSMLMVAVLGDQFLAAGALATASYITLLALFTSCLYSVGILVSHAKGQKQEQRIGGILHNGCIVSIWLSIPATLLMWFFPHVLLLFKQDPLLVQETTVYFHAAALGFLPMIAATSLQQFFMAIGQAKFNFYCMLVRTPASLILSYALIFGKWGLPEMGFGGVMMGPTIVSWFYLIFLLAYIKWKSEYRTYQFFNRYHVFSWAQCRTLLAIGAPIGLQFGIELSAMTVSTYFMGWLGTNVLAAQQIASQCTMLMVMIIIGLSQALSMLISHAYGQQDYVLVRRTATVGFVVTTLVLTGISFIFVFLPDPIIHLFVNTHDPASRDITHIARLLLALAGLFLMIDGVRNAAASALRGLQDSKTPMWIGAGSLWVISLPMCYLLAFPAHFGVVGLRIGFTLGFVFCALTLLQRFYRRVGQQPAQSETVVSA